LRSIFTKNIKSAVVLKSHKSNPFNTSYFSKNSTMQQSKSGIYDAYILPSAKNRAALVSELKIKP